MSTIDIKSRVPAEHDTTPIIQEIRRIKVEPDEILYIRLPDLPPDEFKNAANSLHEFFQRERIKIISGHYDIEFTAIKFEQLPEGQEVGE